MGEQWRRSYRVVWMFLFSTSLALAEPPRLEMSMERRLTASGDTLVVEIRLEHDDLMVAPVSGAGFQVTFDPLRYRLFNTEMSDAFGSDTLTFIHDRSDEGLLTASIVQKDGEGVRGEAMLFRIRLVAQPTSDILSPSFQLSDTELLLTDGTLIRGEASDETATIAPLLVWPGDTSSDGRIDEEDLLPIALHYGISGSPRPDRTTTFSPHASRVWDVPLAAFADVNGDGTIDSSDARIFPALQPAYNTEQPVLARLALPLAEPGDQIRVDVTYEGALMGVSTRFRIPSALVMNQTPDIGPWTGSVPLLTHLRFEPDSGLMGVVVSRVRGASELEPGASRLQLTFDVPNGLGTPHEIEWIAVSAINATSGHHRPEARVSVLLLTDVPASGSDRPTELRLHPNHPNPFNPSTIIRYDVADAGRIRLSIVDLAGREIAVLSDGHHDVGTHTITFDASRFASGVYVCRLQSESGQRIRKITLIK